MATEADYSIYPLRELFKERYWIDPAGNPLRAGALEEEIQKRCAYIRERTLSRPSAAEYPRFRPYGFITGVVFLLISVGPFVAIKFLDMIAVINDVDGEYAILSGVWTLLTLPAVVTVFMIGGMIDAERIVKWFNLAGGQVRRGFQRHSRQFKNRSDTAA